MEQQQGCVIPASIKKCVIFYISDQQLLRTVSMSDSTKVQKCRFCVNLLPALHI